MNPSLMMFIQEIIYLRRIRQKIINLDEHKLIGTHRLAIYVKNDIAISFDSFSVENVFGIKHFYKIQGYDSIICGC